MRFLATLSSVLILFSIVSIPHTSFCAPPEVADGVSQIDNAATPSDGQHVLHPHELWRCGGENDEFLFGFIITGEVDAAGNVYLLDRWLGTVHVVGPDGELTDQLSREGEGPGETRQPTDLTWLPDGELGITQPLPGRLIRIDKSGNPAGDVVPSGVSAQAAEFGFLTETAWRGGTFAYCGTQTNFIKGQMEVTNFLALCDLSTGAETTRILEKQYLENQCSPFMEADRYWINEGRWCLGPGGRVYTASLRNDYAIHVYSSNGHLVQIIKRDYKPRHRTADEISELRKRYTRPSDEWGGGREVQILADEPCISELRVSDDGELWVRHSGSSHDQAPGIFATWDVFSPGGLYARTVSFEVSGNSTNDRLIFLSDNRLLLIRGYYEASDAMWGEGEAGENDTVSEIICFELAH